MPSNDRIIIVGAGPVGLGAALELARFGIPSVLIEKHDTTTWHPKTRIFNTRAIEILRGWGEVVYKRTRAVDLPPDWKTPIRFLRTIVGEELGTIDSEGFAGPGPDVSPVDPVTSSQDLIEEILLEGVHATGMVDVRFSTEAVSLERGGDENDDGASVVVRSVRSGEEERIDGVALIAADGATSFIREALGVRLEGAHDLRHIVNCYFLADIESHISDPAILFFVNNDQAAGVFQPLDAAGRWLSQIIVEPVDHSPDVFDKERAKAWVRAGAGIDDLEVDVLSIGFWKLNATVAERLVQGRVVLCGDAAHQFPPTGGLGVNAGLQGMHNVIWKLAHFVRGQASWGLVETYDTERRPVTQQIVQQSLTNSVNVVRMSTAAAEGTESGLSPKELIAETRRYGNHLGVEFGAAYTSAAVIPDGTRPPEVEDSYSDYAPSATPGCRAPHIWLGEPEARFSILDLFGPAFTLVTTGSSDAESANIAGVARDLGVQIDHYSLGSASLPGEAEFRKAYGVDAGGGVLVRPDGHVAWRDSRAVGPTELPAVMRRILGRE